MPEAKKQDQHQQHQRDALDHVSSHGVQGAVDQLGAVVVRHDAYALRQVVGIDVRHLGAHALQDLQGIFPFTQEYDALDEIVDVRLAWHGLAHAAQPQLRADDHAAEIADPHRRAVAGVDRDASDIFHRTHEAKAADHVHLRAVLDVRTAGITIAVRQRREDLGER